MLLPESLQERQRNADDSETARVVLRTAKTFFTELMKSNGRRSDVHRNAFVAGMVALLPRVSPCPRTAAAPCILQLPFEQPQCGALLPVGRTSLRIGRVVLRCVSWGCPTDKQS